jgi:hypothetical protein
MDREIRSEIARPRNLRDVVTDLGYRADSMQQASHGSDHVTEPPYCITGPCRGLREDNNRFT